MEEKNIKSVASLIGFITAAAVTNEIALGSNIIYSEYYKLKNSILISELENIIAEWAKDTSGRYGWAIADLQIKLKELKKRK